MSVDSLQDVDVTRFHLSLNVNDLGRSVQFLTALLGCSPKKHRADYAKFEPADLPIVLSLEPRSTAQPPLRNTAGEGPLNHVGIRMIDAGQLVEVQRRLEAAGYSTQREEGVECCYARQTKFWVHDNDRTMWEVYMLDEALDHRGGQHEYLHARKANLSGPDPNVTVLKRTWNHRLSENFPSSIPGAGELDEVLLQGTWNAERHQGKWASQLASVQSALRPGGKLVLHLLTSNERVPQLSPLPGPAAVVQVVPLLTDVVAAVEGNGFINLQLVKYASSPCFVQNGIEMRETRVEACSRPDDTRSNGMVRVLYKGPFAEIRDDCLGTFARGAVTSVTAETWQQLASRGMAESFVLLTSHNDKSIGSGVIASPKPIAIGG